MQEVRISQLNLRFCAPHLLGSPPLCQARIFNKNARLSAKNRAATVQRVYYVVSIRTSVMRFQQNNTTHAIQVV